VWQTLLRPRGWRADLPLALLTAGLGLGLAVSVSTHRGPEGLATARQDDLVSILANLDTRGSTLQSQISQLQQTLSALQQSGGAGIAEQQAQQRTEELGILAGTIGAHGPGIVLTITDPGHQVTADVLVDAIEELRDAGAEAMDFSGVRVVTSTSVVDAGEGVRVDGRTLRAPYTLTAIGDAQTMAEALDIPGGVTDTVQSAGEGAKAVITQSADVRITSLHAPVASHYARPDPTATGTG